MQCDNGMFQSKEQRVQQIFDAISKEYDMMNSIITFRLHKAWRKDIINSMKVEAGAKILDLCCGTAECTIVLAQKTGPGGRVYGLDFNVNMLEVAREKIAKQKLQNIELFCGNAMELPFEDNRFDYVTIAFGLRNVADYMQVLKEMYRVVKPGGKAICLETSRPSVPLFKQGYYFYIHIIVPLLGKIFARNCSKEYAWLDDSTAVFPDKKELAEMFAEAGFKHVKVKAYCGGVAVMHLGHKP